MLGGVTRGTASDCTSRGGGMDSLTGLRDEADSDRGATTFSFFTRGACGVDAWVGLALTVLTTSKKGDNIVLDIQGGYSTEKLEWTGLSLSSDA